MKATTRSARCICIYVADLAATPPTLNVTEKNLGCKWTAKKE